MTKLIEIISKLKCRHFVCLFLLYLIYLPFQPWIIAEITTPIRAKMIEKDAIKIYVKSDEWRRLRGITTVATPSTPPLEWKFLWKVEHSDIQFPKTLEFEGKTYKAGFIDEKTHTILYDDIYTVNNEDSFGGCVFSSTSFLYYDPIIHKVIAVVQDVYGLYPAYLAGGYKHVGEGENKSKLYQYLQEYYNF